MLPWPTRAFTVGQGKVVRALCCHAFDHEPFLLNGNKPYGLTWVEMSVVHHDLASKRLTVRHLPWGLLAAVPRRASAERRRAACTPA